MFAGKWEPPGNKYPGLQMGLFFSGCCLARRSCKQRWKVILKTLCFHLLSSLTLGLCSSPSAAGWEESPGSWSRDPGAEKVFRGTRSECACIMARGCPKTSPFLSVQCLPWGISEQLMLEITSGDRLVQTPEFIS